ncbi:MAG: amidophosphoribosyltransferase, partial [Fulvivirga sp.]
SDIAVSVACPVVGMKKREYQLVIYGGAVHFSKDYSEKYDFGQVVKYEEEGWSLVKGATLKRLSQEHGIVSFTDNGIDNFKIGDVLGVLPIHSCLTADCLKGYQSNGGEIVDHY